MQAYITLGSEKHLRAAKNGFEMLVKTQSFATGGWGPNEAFGEPGTGQLGDSLALTHASFETPCGAYGHFKITRYLLRVTKDSRYGDSMERVLYNTILGAWPIQADGTSFYYSDYATTGKKVWYGQKWPCCSGTFPQLAADYHISTYLRSADGVYVNLFTPSTVQWNDGGGRYGLKQETKYPFDNKIQIQVSGFTGQGLHALCPHSQLGSARTRCFPSMASEFPILCSRALLLRFGAPGKMAIVSNSNFPCRLRLELWMQIIRAWSPWCRVRWCCLPWPIRSPASTATHCCKPSQPTTPREIGSQLQPTEAA